MTPKGDTRRIQVNAAHLDLDAGKEWLLDVLEYGFLTIHMTEQWTTIALGSPSGHVQIFHKTGSTFVLPTMISNLLFKNGIIKKVILYSEESKKFTANHGMPELEVVQLHSLLRKNIEEIVSGTTPYLKTQLGPDVRPQGHFDETKPEHVCYAAYNVRAITYGVWLVAARMARRAGLGPAANISGYMRYALFSEHKDKYAELLIDPYYVPFEENHLTPADRIRLDLETEKLQGTLDQTLKKFRAKFETPFVPLIAVNKQLCRTCGTFLKPSVKHRCVIKAKCDYPLCDDPEPHTPLTCVFVRAWCETCQRRGHVATQHPVDKRFPICYFWTLFLKFNRLNLDTAHVFLKGKHENPFFHQFGLYGLPPSVIPKYGPEAAVGLDLPNDVRFKKPAPPTEVSTITRPKTTPSTSTIAERRPQPVGRVEKKKKKSKKSKKDQRPLTEAELKEACSRLGRISRGEDQGTSGSAHKDPVLMDVIRIVDNLCREGIINVLHEVPSEMTIYENLRMQLMGSASCQADSDSESDLPPEIQDPTLLAPSGYEVVPNTDLLYEADDDITSQRSGTPVNLNSSMDLDDEDPLDPDRQPRLDPVLPMDNDHLDHVSVVHYYNDPAALVVPHDTPEAVAAAVQSIQGSDPKA